jgi:glycosyltransferase involved in cell wall biosynthesis
MESRRNKRLLFFAYYFPPVRSIASVRSWNITKNLSRMGWDVTLVTPDPSLQRDVDTSIDVSALSRSLAIRFLCTGHKWRLLNPSHLRCADKGIRGYAGRLARRVSLLFRIEREAGWNRAALKACRQLRADDFDVILVTGSPFGAFGVAEKVARKLHKPFVLDYRDLYTSNPHLTRNATFHLAKKERRYLSKSAAVTVVSDSMKQSMHNHFGVGGKTHVITNGYDPEELNATIAERFDHFAIVYTGQFYPPISVVTPVMALLARLKAVHGQRMPRWAFHYYGDAKEYVQTEAMRFGVAEQVVIHGLVPRGKSLAAVRGAGLAVVVISVKSDSTLEERGLVTGKIFEPIGLSTPILLIAPPGADAEAILETAGAGKRCEGGDIDGMTDYVLQVMSGIGPAKRKPEQYEWGNVAKLLDKVLRSVTS